MSLRDTISTVHVRCEVLVSVGMLLGARWWSVEGLSGKKLYWVLVERGDCGQGRRDGRRGVDRWFHGLEDWYCSLNLSYSAPALSLKPR